MIRWGFIKESSITVIDSGKVRLIHPSPQPSTFTDSARQSTSWVTRSAPVSSITWARRSWTTSTNIRLSLRRDSKRCPWPNSRTKTTGSKGWRTVVSVSGFFCFNVFFSRPSFINHHHWQMYQKAWPFQIWTKLLVLKKNCLAFRYTSEGKKLWLLKLFLSSTLMFLNSVVGHV